MSKVTAALKRLDESMTPGPFDTYGPYSEGGFLDSGFLIESWAGFRGTHTDDGLPEGCEPLWVPKHGLSEGDAKGFANLRNALPKVVALIEAYESDYPQECLDGTCNHGPEAQDIAQARAALLAALEDDDE